MSGRNRQTNRDRAKAIAGVGAFHALLGYGLIVGLGYELPEQVKDTFKVFDVPQETPPPPVPEPPPPPETAAKEPEGAASPPNIRSQPTPVVAPPPKVRLKTPPAVTTPKKIEAPPGNDPSAGSSSIAGPGTGSGGAGTGTGSGGSGTGPGGGGDGGRGARARREQGGFTTSDYRRAARGAPLNATVHVRFTVQPDGRVRGCSVTQSSGRPDVDTLTCRLIEQRFRYSPARDNQGRAIAEVVTTVFSWEPR